MEAYPGSIVSASTSGILLSDGTQIPWIEQGSDDADLHRQMDENYWEVEAGRAPPPGHDPGRARNRELFSWLYGKSEKEVRARLVPVVWLASGVHRMLMFNSAHGAADALRDVSEELNARPDLWQIGRASCRERVLCVV